MAARPARGSHCPWSLVNVASTPALPTAAEGLRITGLSASLDQFRALDGIDLTIAPGEVVAVTGEPGSGKTTLVRCLAGGVPVAAGTIELDGCRVGSADGSSAAPGRGRRAGPGSGRRRRAGGLERPGISVVWQDLELCDNLDVAGNLLLGQEHRRLMLSPARFHETASALLRRLEIPITDTTRLVGTLNGAQRQLLAIAKAVAREPRLLVLDEPAAPLSVIETRQVEALIGSLRERGMAILLATRDTELMFRLVDRIVVLRHGSVVAEVAPATTHPDDIAALRAGQPVDTSARRQLTRLHGLADRLVSADPSSSLSLILSALGGALGSDRACIHVADDDGLECAASVGFAAGDLAAVRRLPVGIAGGPIGRAAASRQTVVEAERRSPRPAGGRPLPASVWAAPIMGPAGLSGVIAVFRAASVPPDRDELDLLTLYAGYAASAVERDRLLDQVTARNRVLETIREMLQALAGPVTIGAEGLSIALVSLRRGLQADEVGLLTDGGEAAPGLWRAYAGPLGTALDSMSDALREAGHAVLATARCDGRAREVPTAPAIRALAVPFNAPSGPTALVASWSHPRASDEDTSLIEDAAHSLNLALEREEAGLAHQEAAALRRSRELQREFLSRLSHELRTPLTAIRGYASSLMAPDVTWDGATQQRFLETIAVESARLGRLVDDLLDFSMIESGVMRLQPDWCDIPLVVESAVSCLAPEWVPRVSVDCDPALPPVWADHDRLEQVFVNLLGNALRHNPPQTRVRLTAVERPPGVVEIDVSDDGRGFPPELAEAPLEAARRGHSRTAGAGLGLSIASGILSAHEATIALEPTEVGARFRIRLPVEGAGGAPAESEPPPLAIAPRGRA